MLPLRLISEPDDRTDLPKLISGAQGGDRNAFARLAEHVKRHVRGWAESFTDSVDDAEDVTQDVLILVHRRLPQFERNRPETVRRSLQRYY